MSFHNDKDKGPDEISQFLNGRKTFRYKFENFFHPFVSELLEKLNTKSLAGLLDPGFQKTLIENFFNEFYDNLTGGKALIFHAPKKIDLHHGGPYSNYNWELLFHIPLTIAVHLSKNQRFSEAQRWFHFIFDPTCTDEVDPPKRFWKFLAFRQDGDTKTIDQLLTVLTKPDSESSPEERALKEEIIDGYNEIKDKPFQPHAVARTRQVAYQYCVVMKYLDNLIAWGDSLFRQDTIESINEATQIYVLAANILGERPQKIPSKGNVRPKTFAQLKASGLDAVGNAMVELEGQFPLDLALPQTRATDSDTAAPLFGIGRTLYFCIPRNEKLLQYWDTVGDRLFKIRNCLNIEGIFRQLALFDPPIDPGMLVKAAAAGIDIGSVTSGLNQPLSPIRSPFIIQKALELCSEVKGLGSALLSAIEKQDNEHMARLRQGHEIKLQEMSRDVRFLQWKQAEESTQSLLKSRATALERYRHYLRLMGSEPDSNNVPDTLTLTRQKLTEENFDEIYTTLVGDYEKEIEHQEYSKLNLAGGNSPANQSGASGQGKLYLNSNENADINEYAPRAQGFRIAATVSDSLAQTLALLPDLGVDFHYWGMGGHANLVGGSRFATIGRITAGSLNTKAGYEDYKGASASKTASFERRVDDWTLQTNLAARELMQIGRQIIGSLIAEQITHHEYLNIKKQIEQSEETDRFLREKFSNEELYAWMQGELSSLYYEYYRFAFDTARKAEQTMKRELMRPEVDATNYIKFNYWDGGRKGLLSGEALYLDLKRMEMAYHENNKREYELTKHVSLRRLNPIALLALKATGSCEVTLPEWLFDLDCPGHYMRRIKSVSLSIPAVVGPYTSINCTLSLLKSSLRTSSLLQDDEYPRQGSEDTRFIDYFGTVQSMVTSSANNDSGMFEPSLRDERFLPFEGAGAESTWKLELPADFHQFDYSTISDVVLHVRYTARQGGQRLGEKATEQLKELISTSSTSNLSLLFSLKHDFPSEWSRFTSATDDSNFITKIKQEHFPYLTQGKAITIDSIQLYSEGSNDIEVITPEGLELSNYTKKLADDGEFEISLVPDGKILVRQTTEKVFIFIQYSIT